MYELNPKVLLVYVVPIESTLGKLPLVPVGDTWIIPFKPSASTRAEREAIAEEFYPGAYCGCSPPSFSSLLASLACCSGSVQVRGTLQPLAHT